MTVNSSIACVAVRNIVVSLTLLFAACAAIAETPDPADMSAEERRAAYESMTDEEREEFRQKMRDHYDSMTPEEQAAAKQKARERFENMTPEVRAWFYPHLPKPIPGISG